MTREIVVVTHHLGGIGGVQRVVGQLAEGFSRDGHQVTVVGCAVQKGETYHPTEKSYTEILLYQEDIFFDKPWLFAKEKYWAKKVERLLQSILEKAADPIVILANPIVYLLLEETIKKWEGKATFIGQMHNSARFVLECKGLYRVYPYILSKKYPNLDHILFLTEEDAQTIGQAYQISQKKMGAIPNPIPRYLSLPESERQSTPSILSFVGRLDPVKQVNHAITAFAALAAEFPSWHFHIYGEGSETKKLDKLINELGMAERIHLMGQTNQVAAVYRSSTLTILTSKAEGFPMSLLESFLMKTPALSYACSPGVCEMQAATPEMLVTPDSLDELVEKLRHALSHPERLAALGEAAYLHMTATYTEEAVLSRWYALFDDIKERKHV